MSRLDGVLGGSGNVGGTLRTAPASGDLGSAWCLAVGPDLRDAPPCTHVGSCRV